MEETDYEKLVQELLALNLKLSKGLAEAMTFLQPHERVAVAEAMKTNPTM
ncbi:hypothetical protein [Tumebacillus flagellatus]|nr:hypothetical protein [Tumebacillus flagellatus]